MRVDHLSFAVGPEGLGKTVAKLSAALGGKFVDGGFHPRFGTRNQILPLSDRHYLEVVEVLDHPSADKAPFGQAVRARTELGGGWLAWVVAVDDLGPFERRLGRPAVDGNRKLPTGQELEWKQLGVKGLQNDPQLPFFIKWVSEPSLHPSAAGSDIRLTGLEIAGDQHRVDEWLDGDADAALSEVDISWVSPNGAPGLVAATFATPRGEVRI